MRMDTPAGADVGVAAQLRSQLISSFQRTRGAKTPVLTHLNADTTWLLSVAYPNHVAPPPGRSRYNILIDPWLDGPQEDVASWFSKQWHLIKSSVQSIAQLDEILRDAEAADLDPTNNGEDRGRSYIDAVAISHEFTDHCHRATLLEIDRQTPVFATTKAAQLVRSWKYFDTVVDMATFSAGVDWRSTSTTPLPFWIGISRLVTSSDALYYHSAIVIAVQRPDGAEEVADALIYTPHGVEAATLSVMSTATPPVNILALLHGLHDVSLKWSKQLNLGAINAIKAQKILNARYWVGTHDEQKPGSGLIAPLLRRKIYTVEEAIADIQAADKGKPGAHSAWDYKVTYVEVGNGQSLLLE